MRMNEQTVLLILAGAVIIIAALSVAIAVLIVKNSRLQYELDSLRDKSCGKVNPAETKSVPGQQDAISRQGEEEMTSDALSALPPVSRNKSYEIGEETGEILLEHAEDNNLSVPLPPAQEEKTDRIEEAMRQRPFGIDSAFQVISEDDAESYDSAVKESENTEPESNEPENRESLVKTTEEQPEPEQEKAESGPRIFFPAQSEDED